MRRLVVGVTLAMLACGVPYAWDMKGAPKRPPDEQYRTGTEVGDDLWVWHCYENERIVITQYSSAMCGAKAPRLERGPCGEPLAVEVANARRHPHPIPAGMRWPGSPPPPPEPVPEIDAGPGDRGR